MPSRFLLSAFAAVALAVGATMSLSTAALGASYGVVSGDATVSATTAATGGSVTVAGDNFCPATRVILAVSNGGSVYITEQLTAGSSGSVSSSVSLTRSGTNEITLTGQTADCNGKAQVLDVKVSVGSGDAVTGAADSSGLPHTGADLALLWTGVGLLLAGGLLVGTARTRRHATV